MMEEFKNYRRTQIASLKLYEQGEDMADISVSAEDAKAGSPKAGDMIARNPANHKDKWLVAKVYFENNFEKIPGQVGDIYKVEGVDMKIIKIIDGIVLLKGADDTSLEAVIPFVEMRERGYF